MGDYIREFSVSQFNKHHSTPKVFDGLFAMSTFSVCCFLVSMFKR